MRHVLNAGRAFDSNCHVHHINYDRIGREEFSDLVVVCVPCHNELHRFIDKMASKGFQRKRVMQRLQPYMTRKLMKLQSIYRS